MSDAWIYIISIGWLFVLLMSGLAVSHGLAAEGRQRKSFEALLDQIERSKKIARLEHELLEGPFTHASCDTCRKLKERSNG